VDNYIGNNRLAGCVILYNPSYDFIENISKYLSALEQLIVVDNSDAIIDAAIEDFLISTPQIIYVKNGSNIGIAAALNKACQKALSNGYTWILTMDQDSYLVDFTFFEKSAQVMLQPQIGIIAAAHSNYYYKQRVFEPNDSFLLVDMVITSGNLLNLNAWADINGFNDKLFIDEVDNEFCIRLKLKGYKIIVSKKVYLKHSLGTETLVYSHSKKKHLSIALHSHVRFYYITRNNLYIWRKFLFKDASFVANRIKFWLIRVNHIRKYYPDKLSYFKSIGKGIRDAMIGKYGKLRK
jgi:rhamnosyltransferase